MPTRPSLDIRCLHDTSKTTPSEACIVCGTNFSAISSQTVEVAGALAKRLGERLVLAHAVAGPARETLPAHLRESLALYARAQLHDEQERLRALSVETSEVLQVGAPEAVLIELAATHHARLLVLGFPQPHLFSHWQHGGVATHVAATSPIPTLVVRNSKPLLQWVREERLLRVFVAADFSGPSEAALRWVAWLREVGPCDVVVAYLEPSAGAYAVGGLHSSPRMDDMMVKMARVAERYFRQWVRSLLDGSRVRVRFESELGRSDVGLLHLAAEERADLIVVGTHSRCGWHRLGHSSVSRGVLHGAQSNVVCVPVSPEQSATTTAGAALPNFQPSAIRYMKTATPPAYENTDLGVTDHSAPEHKPLQSIPPIHLQSILVPLDFSSMSLKSLQYAIPFAKYFGAKLTLLYVIEPQSYAPDLLSGMPLPPDPAIELEQDLQQIRTAMIPEELSVSTLVRHDFACKGVIEAARDICADLIITTTHGRTGVSHLLMGSTAEKIVRQAPCPVLVLSEQERDFV